MNEQLGLFEGKPITHVPLTIKGAKFHVDSQPTDKLVPGDRVVMVVIGVVDDDIGMKISEGGYVRAASVSLEEAYDVEESDVKDLLDERREVIKATNDRRYNRLSVSAAS